MSHDTRTLTRRYDRQARNWGPKLDRFGFGAAYQTLLRAGDLQAPQAVLDAGAGCGAFARAALDIGLRPARLTLIDPSRGMLERARITLADAPQARFVASDIAGFSTETTYDLVLCAHVIEHCDDPVAALAQLRRMLRPGGRLALAVSKPHWCSFLVYLRWRHRCFKPAAVGVMLAEAGYRTIRPIPFAQGVPARVSHGFLAEN